MPDAQFFPIYQVTVDMTTISQGTKAIMKDIAKYLPGIGWTFLFMEYPLLKRNWSKDKDRLEAACRNLADYPVNMIVSEHHVMGSLCNLVVLSPFWYCHKGVNNYF